MFRVQAFLGYGFRMGGVNHCSLYCRSAKFRGFTYMGKYGAVIGLYKCTLKIGVRHIQKHVFLDQSQRHSYQSTSNNGISPINSVNHSGWPLQLGLKVKDLGFGT